MLFLAFDIATNTGWSVLNEQKELIDYGSIQINSSMTLPQRIIFLSNEIIRIMEKFKPDYVFLEDLICGISGVKTLSYLGRLNGAAILSCTKYVNDNIFLYTPTKWKSYCFPGIVGFSKKWEIQLAVVEHYKMKFNIQDAEIEKLLLSKQNMEKDNKERLKNIKQNSDTYNQLRSNIARKRNPLSLEEKETTVHEMIEIKKENDELKKIIKNEQKKLDKLMEKISLQITSRTGINLDISDSIGINFCGIKEYLKLKNPEKNENN